MPRKTQKAPLSPAMIMEDLTGAWRSRTLVAGVELDVFSQIAAGSPIMVRYECRVMSCCR